MERQDLEWMPLKMEVGCCESKKKSCLPEKSVAYECRDRKISHKNKQYICQGGTVQQHICKHLVHIENERWDLIPYIKEYYNDYNEIKEALYKKTKLGKENEYVKLEMVYKDISTKEILREYHQFLAYSYINDKNKESKIYIGSGQLEGVFVVIREDWNKRDRVRTAFRPRIKLGKINNPFTICESNYLGVTCTHMIKSNVFNETKDNGFKWLKKPIHDIPDFPSKEDLIVGLKDIISYKSLHFTKSKSENERYRKIAIYLLKQYQLTKRMYDEHKWGQLTVKPDSFYFQVLLHYVSIMKNRLSIDKINSLEKSIVVKNIIRQMFTDFKMYEKELKEYLNDKFFYKEILEKLTNQKKEMESFLEENDIDEELFYLDFNIFHYNYLKANIKVLEKYNMSYETQFSDRHLDDLEDYHNKWRNCFDLLYREYSIK
ncbi:hypothetical protein [Halobacillus faecis]|uniref:Uncharacterized protein n=1 Tax=Halobacillus faecis TaxID=360184 RepID=A0A511WYF1_9BACI|nr:hypothetical protein [Halobacillus faecis]GEN54592.1 hypothetical protein HFA01_28540 [Halobacillus faecis]